MLATGARAQGSVAVGTSWPDSRLIDYRSSRRHFTHSGDHSVGLSEKRRQGAAHPRRFELGLVRSYFKANTKPWPKLDSDGLMKLLSARTAAKLLVCPTSTGSTPPTCARDRQRRARAAGGARTRQRSSHTASNLVNWWRWPTSRRRQPLRRRATHHSYDQ